MRTNCEKNFDIKKLTTFKVGGFIEEVFFPQTVEEFAGILNEKKNIKVFGNLSNTLISDSGYKGSIVVTTRMDDIKIEGSRVIAGCGVRGPKLSQTVCKSGLSGLEFMIGFPGSVGGEVYMNASANSQAVSDKLVSVTCFDPSCGVVKFSKDDMEFGYRTSRCQRENLIILEAEFELDTMPTEQIQARMNQNLVFRRTHQPSLTLPNCGSVFKNPQGDSAGRLLESVGAKQMSQGGAMVWENHANFIVNKNNASSKDILKLMYQMYTSVKERYNIELKPEIIFLGGNNQEENELCKILYKK